MIWPTAVPKHKYEASKRYRFQTFTFWPRKTEDGYNVWFDWIIVEKERWSDNSGWRKVGRTYHLTEKQRYKLGLKW